MISALCFLMFAFFAIKLIAEFLEMYRVQKGIIDEATILTTSVCSMSHNELSGALIDCENARKIVNTNILIRACELTFQSLMSGVISIIKMGVTELTHAVGFMGFVVCFVLYLASLFVRAVFAQLNAYEVQRHRGYSECAIQNSQSAITLPLEATSHSWEVNNKSGDFPISSGMACVCYPMSTTNQLTHRAHNRM